MLEPSKPQRSIVKLLMTPHHLPPPHFCLEPQGSSSGAPSFSVPLCQPSLICGALNSMLNYEDCWGIVGTGGLLCTPSNLQPLSRATGGSYGLKNFQISIKNFREQQGQKQRKAEGRGKLKAKNREVREIRHTTKMTSKCVRREDERTKAEERGEQQEGRGQNRCKRRDTEEDEIDGRKKSTRQTTTDPPHLCSWLQKLSIFAISDTSHEAW